MSIEQKSIYALEVTTIILTVVYVVGFTPIIYLRREDTDLLICTLNIAAIYAFILLDGNAYFLDKQKQKNSYKDTVK